ncbi:type II toxin-antitoxin system HicB family antitoxin [Emticicia agri]|uniref:Type II toxin-antitoxin system HicB family antitoxin n=1 Tax=Emticicia agri TaxID=2492393 RepID=A0A4Q5LZE8_9BACT|nr:type II toxin-antitoxin system HicB family antitoxin [Emticicia agri]RYU94903.1 type II toxin-antitoxin system HicB family antitoxin [Emticicia agri]
MDNRTYRVVISKDSEGGYIADIPTLKHCVSYGETIEEAMQNIKEALEGVLIVREEEGLSIPDDSNVLEYSISVPSTLLMHSANSLTTA